MAKTKSTKEPLYLPALKGQIGKWFYYSTLMKFREAERYIKLVPDFYDNQKLSDMIQRTIVSERSEKIADYLQQVEERFFPSMVIAVYEGAPQFHEFNVEHKAKDAVPTLDSSKTQAFGYLELTGAEILFPLDGQHRLSGIKKVLKRVADDVENELWDDELSVIMIGHEPTKKGRERSRRLFTTLNKRAVTVKEHEIIALDEDDVMAIACRFVVEDLAKWKREGFVALKANAALAASDKSAFTSIVTLYHCFRVIFEALAEAHDDETQKEKKERLKFNRPQEEWLDVYIAAARTFLVETAKSFPKVSAALDATDPAKVIAKERPSDGGHVLFRPRGLLMLAELVAASIKDDGAVQIEMDSAKPVTVKRLAVKRVRDAVRYFEDIETDITKRPYKDLFFDAVTGQIKPGRMALSRDLLLYEAGMVSERKAASIAKRLENALGEKVELDDFLEG